MDKQSLLHQILLCLIARHNQRVKFMGYALKVRRMVLTIPGDAFVCMN